MAEAPGAAEEVLRLKEEVRRLEEASRAQIARLRALNESGKSLSSVLDPDKVLVRLVELVTRELDCETCSIMVLADGELSIRAAAGLSEQVVQQTRTRLGAGIAGYVAAQARPLLIEDIAKDGRFSPSGGVYHTGSLVSAPITLDGQVLGVMNVNNKRDRRPFDRTDLEFIESVASQAAIAFANARLHRQAQLLASTDGLTGLFNHRHFQERLVSELERSRRYESRPVSLVIADIDDFKKFNDRYGHRVGDRVLAGVAGILKAHSRKVDVACRYGGEEFAVILPEVSRRQAYHFADRVRALIEATPFQGDGVVERITVSAGVSCFPDDGQAPGELIEAADRALYLSKSRGKNRVTLCGE